jgi:predicted nuclease of predicted toxin-antitoxin system
MKFFIDNNLGPDLAKGMRGFGENVMHLQEKFPHDAQDTDWLPFVGKNHLILVTRDLNIRRRPFELRALKSHNVGVFFLGGKKLNRCEIIQQVVRNWPEMKKLARKTDPPFAFIVRPRGIKIEPIPLQ